MKHNIARNILCAAGLGLCAVSAQAADYELTVSLPPEAEGDGALLYLTDYDSGAAIDSVTVEDNKAVFKGTLEKPVLARLMIDGQRLGQLILEDGPITWSLENGGATGGALNGLLAQIKAESQELAQAYRAATTDAERDDIYGKYTALQQRYMKANLGNPIGYMLFCEQAYDMEPAELIAAVEANPSLKEYKRVQKLLAANLAKAATMPGNKFVDFEIEYNGEKHRLSDVVGKGNYVLVDFWASWCGPCIRQTAVIKDLYNQYKDKGLKVLGVAVWDKPEDTQNAIATHGLEWESWLNGQTIPTDAYGISAIPSIILFGPDGTILSRDKQDDALRQDVSRAMEGLSE